MSDPATPRPSRPVEAILLAFAFALAYTQSPLYFSNQNQYFLHGLAAGGLGHLSADWLATTRDPTPVFSALVAAGYRHLGEWSFQAAYFGLLMGYFLSFRWLVAALPGMPDSRSFRLAWAALFAAAHAAILRVASVDLTGVDYPWYWQCGVANQYLLGTGLQPSAFGVLFVTGLAAFANRRPVLAAGLVAAACAFHSTYLLPAGMLVFGFLVVTFRETPTAGPTAFKMLVAASAFAAPVAAYTLFTFGSADLATFAESQRILAEVRIPHHCVIERWFAVPDALQLAWAALGLALLRQARVFLVLVLAASLGLGLTLIQYATEDATLALAFPWRISTVLVPVATAVVAAKLCSVLPPKCALRWIAGVGLLALTAGGVWVTAARVGYSAGDDEQPLYDFVRTNAKPGDVYLLPVKLPALGTGRGTASTTFTPPPRPKPGSNQIPIDLQRFRLHAGAPVYVDFKSVPYFDSEVREWLRRVKQGEEWFAADWDRPGMSQELRAEGITHVVAPAAAPLQSDGLEPIHADPAYVVYRLK